MSLMKETFYLKYRPKKLDEVLAQQTNVEIIKNQAKAGRLSQAYLFYGPKGTGKTTMARLVAKLANCQKRITDEKFRVLGEVCGVCSSCQAIDQNKSLDVIEIDAASNRGIDEIRNLRESIKVAPGSSPFKVYIIDEVHMLTKEAANALLKTLEEPPAHVILILATTEYEKLPPTLISRTQRFAFNRPTKEEILKKLQLIKNSENLKISDEALELIALASSGSFRDAEAWLEQLTAIGQDVTLETVEQLLGRTAVRKVADLAECLINKDLDGAIKKIEILNEEGINFSDFTKDLIHYLRKILTLKLNPSVEYYFAKEMNSEDLKVLKIQAEKADTKNLIKMIKEFIEAYSQIRYSPFGFVPLEVAIIENLEVSKKVI